MLARAPGMKGMERPVSVIHRDNNALDIHCSCTQRYRSYNVLIYLRENLFLRQFLWSLFLDGQKLQDPFIKAPLSPFKCHSKHVAHKWQSHMKQDIMYVQKGHPALCVFPSTYCGCSRIFLSLLATNRGTSPDCSLPQSGRRGGHFENSPRPLITVWEAASKCYIRTWPNADTVYCIVLGWLALTAAGNLIKHCLSEIEMKQLFYYLQLKHLLVWCICNLR